MTFSPPSDAIDTLTTLISANWDTDNITGELTPDFEKKAEFVRDRQTYQVIVYHRITSPSDIGRGTVLDWTDMLTIEVRVKDDNNTVFEEMVVEVLRILGDKRLTVTGYDYVTFAVNIRDESHQGHNWWRKLIDVEMKKYGVTKT